VQRSGSERRRSDRENNRNVNSGQSACLEKDAFKKKCVFITLRNNLRLQALPNTVFKSINKCKLSSYIRMTAESAVATAFGMLTNARRRP